MKRYIYNLAQAYFYIKHDVLPIEPPEKHYRTGHVFFTFNDEETEVVYQLWCENAKNTFSINFMQKTAN